MASPRYGIDAPALIQGAAGIGVTLFAAGTLLASGAKPRWLGLTFASVGVLLLLFAASLLAYGRAGKLRVRDRMLGLVDWRGDERVLDIGTGRGLLAIGSAKRTRGRVVGIDLWRSADRSGNSQAAAEANAAIEGVAVEFVEGDARALAFPDASFDVVLSLLCLGTIKRDRDRALAEIARVLAPGGTAVIGDFIGTSAHARALAAAGLLVDPPRSTVADAYTAMRIVVARRP